MVTTAAVAAAASGCGGASTVPHARIAPPRPGALVYTVFRGSGRNGYGELWKQSRAGSAPIRLARPHPIIYAGADSAPAWSPDGQHIAFVGNDARDAGIFVMNADGTHVRRITSGRDDSPSWSPNGTDIAYSHYTGFRRFHQTLYVVSASGGRPRRLTHPRWVWPRHIELDAHSTWTSDGTRIVFDRWLCNARRCVDTLWSVRPDGTREALYLRDAGQASFAADGTLAFMGGHLRRNGIWIRDPGGRLDHVVRNVTANSPTWAADGRHLAYVSSPTDKFRADGDTFELYVLDAATGLSTRVTRDSLDQGEPTWQPQPKPIE